MIVRPHMIVRPLGRLRTKVLALVSRHADHVVAQSIDQERARGRLSSTAPPPALRGHARPNIP
jgi:hypothetical protein